MEGPTNESAQAAFADAVGMWRTEPGAALPDVVDAATNLLVVGVDSPSLRELAGTSSRESQWVVEPLIQATLEELGLTRLLAGSAQRASLEVMLRRFLAAKVSVRVLGQWAHGRIGHDGDRDCQPFVELDDILDEYEMCGRELEDLEDAVRKAARQFLAGEDVTALDERWPDYVPAEVLQSPPKRRWWRRR